MLPDNDNLLVYVYMSIIPSVVKAESKANPTNHRASTPSGTLACGTTCTLGVAASAAKDAVYVVMKL